MSEKKPTELLITFQLEEAQLAAIQAVSKKLVVNMIPAKAVAEIPSSQWEKTEILLTNQRIIPDPTQAPRLQWIQLASAGVNKALEKPIIQQKKVFLTSVSGIITSQVAEHAVTACLALGRKLPLASKYQRDHYWPHNTRETLTPREIRGSTIGIVGYGSIGREVARLLKPFGAKILAAKRDAMHPEDDGYTRKGMGDPEGLLFDRLYPIQALPDMLPECDFVVLTLPLTPETLKLFNAELFSSMKTTAYLINVGRGDVVDEEALIAALKENRIAGAALDVFTQEPLPDTSPLWDLPNVIITPHVAGLSSTLMDDTIEFFIANLTRFLDGQPLHNQVDLNRGY